MSTFELAIESFVTTAYAGHLHTYEQLSAVKDILNNKLVPPNDYPFNITGIRELYHTHLHYFVERAGASEVQQRELLDVPHPATFINILATTTISNNYYEVSYDPAVVTPALATNVLNYLGESQAAYNSFLGVAPTPSAYKVKVTFVDVGANETSNNPIAIKFNYGTLNLAKDPIGKKDIVFHEAFHVAQFTLGWSATMANLSALWVLEGTAVWAGMILSGAPKNYINPAYLDWVEKPTIRNVTNVASPANGYYTVLFWLRLHTLNAGAIKQIIRSYPTSSNAQSVQQYIITQFGGAVNFQSLCCTYFCSFIDRSWLSGYNTGFWDINALPTQKQITIPAFVVDAASKLNLQSQGPKIPLPNGFMQVYTITVPTPNNTLNITKCLAAVTEGRPQYTVFVVGGSESVPTTGTGQLPLPVANPAYYVVSGNQHSRIDGDRGLLWFTINDNPLMLAEREFNLNQYHYSIPYQQAQEAMEKLFTKATLDVHHLEAVRDFLKGKVEIPRGFECATGVREAYHDYLTQNNAQFTEEQKAQLQLD